MDTRLLGLGLAVCAAAAAHGCTQAADSVPAAGDTGSTGSPPQGTTAPNDTTSGQADTTAPSDTSATETDTDVPGTTETGPSAEADSESSSETGPGIEGPIGGAVEKGPFILGTEVQATTLDDVGAPTGTVFTTTTDAVGGFDLPIGGELTRLTATGFFHDEISGGLSGGAITLQSLSTATTPQIYINVLTHLVTPRALALIEAGDDPDVALATAQSEIVTGLGLGPYVPGATLSSLQVLEADDLDDSYLVAAGAVLLAVAKTNPGNDTVALQLLLNTIASDLQDDGLINPTVRDDIDEAQFWLDTDEVHGNLISLADELGVPAPVLDLDAIIDADNDGIVNADDNCGHHQNALQADADGDGIGDACDLGSSELPSWCPYEGDSDYDGDGFGDVTLCDTCALVPGGTGEHCCDPRIPEITCKEPPTATQNTACGMFGGAGFSCGGGPGSAGYGEECFGGCFGPCVAPGAFPPNPTPTSAYHCAEGESCCTKPCTVALDDCGPGNGGAQPHCLAWFAPADEPPELAGLGFCVDTIDGPCSAPGAVASDCAGANW